MSDDGYRVLDVVLQGSAHFMYSQHSSSGRLGYHQTGPDGPPLAVGEVSSSSMEEDELEEEEEEEDKENDQVSSTTPPVSVIPSGATSSAVVHRKYGSKSKWTKDEDEKLRAVVEMYGDKNWERIVAHFPGKSDAQCQHRWSKVVNPALVKGPWTKEVRKTGSVPFPVTLSPGAGSGKGSFLFGVSLRRRPSLRCDR
ncbi:unnamed protein product [Cyprideis torosa]|uniref:Uncharacterized protein n=1 Tax=Cyprideis torosa TaxID=163714 RepID=A0A7R8ZT21_9CRUS|nr:unnamed protein product [Cyprideis torosa]CAG0897166.1 unnamed protein product [Cyprideis torosa]